MPAPAYIRKRIAGGVPATTLAGGINNTATSITITDATGWPDGAGDPFVVAIDRGGNEELVLIASRSGTTLTVYTDGRGYDDTTAVSHLAGVSIAHVADAGTLDQANRLANILTTLGDIIASNGTNPVRLGVQGTDGYVLQEDSGEATGLIFGRLVDIIVQASAPSVTGNARHWYDTTLDVLRTSDGASWLFDLPVLEFATIAARKSALSSPVAGQVCRLGGSTTNLVEVYDGAQFKTIGVPEFADDTARDAYYGDATVGLYDGAMAKTLDDYAVWEYRQDEWIRRNFKVTVSASAPSSPHAGDFWAQPVS